MKDSLNSLIILLLFLYLFFSRSSTVAANSLTVDDYEVSIDGLPPSSSSKDDNSAVIAGSVVGCVIGVSLILVCKL